jgi:hypothetical protein
VIAFANDTYFGYPLMIQLVQAVNAHSPMLSREIDYHKMRAHALSVFNSMSESFEAEAPELEIPTTSFLLAGYSWKKKQFEIDEFEYSAGDRRFFNRPSWQGIGAFGRIMHSGDWAGRARTQLISALRQRYGQAAIERDSKNERRFGWEPFEVLRDLLRIATREDTIGGPPQIVRVTQYLECRPLAIYWPTRASGEVFLGGRKLLDYENVDAWRLDPDTFEISHPRFGNDQGAQHP